MPAQGEHNKWIALALCILLGYLGLHRFYEGKIWTGILWLCTGGLCGVGIVVDAILIVMKPVKY
ncbi:TM2 domain-containing protein [uncultured Fibrobacter sp.]|uniref:TM2 domain-containing protein n=1 Tax=uncultured Fibrobacter sp. TaxID=261512 RepID=UPI00262BE1BF|nr:TM2 domain-containing protein [uncultured Fibrobacter sp.]